MKNKIKSLFTGKNIVVIWVIATIFINLYTYLPDTTLRVEESYTACEILAENEKGETQVELPDGTIKWLKLKNETTLEDGKYVMLELKRSFNILNQPRKFQIINTTYIGVGDANSVVDVLRYLVAPILVLLIYTVLSFCFFGYVIEENKRKKEERKHIFCLGTGHIVRKNDNLELILDTRMNIFNPAEQVDVKQYIVEDVDEKEIDE